MSMINTIDDALDKLSTVGHGLEAVEDLAKWALADEKRDAYETLHTIAVIIDTLRGTFNGKISVADTKEEIETLKGAIMALDYKFDKGSE